MRECISILVRHKPLIRVALPSKPPAPQPVPFSTSSKRTSAQAALDVEPKPGEAPSPGSRLILPIPKRPRMNFSGWKSTVSEAPQSVPEESTTDARDTETEREDETPLEKMEEDDVPPSHQSMSSVLLSAPTVFTRATREPVRLSSVQPGSRHSPRFPSISRRSSDEDIETDEDELPNPFMRIPRLDVTGQNNHTQLNPIPMPAPNPKKAQKLKSGLSRVFQSMDVDDSDYSPSTSTSASSPQLPTPGSSTTTSRPAPSNPFMQMKPSRSGLSSGDLFSPRRPTSTPGDGFGSISYANVSHSSPIRGVGIGMGLGRLDEDEEEEDERDARSLRSYVFRGRKVNGMLDPSVWNKAKV